MLGLGIIYNLPVISRRVPKEKGFQSQIVSHCVNPLLLFSPGATFKQFGSKIFLKAPQDSAAGSNPVIPSCGGCREGSALTSAGTSLPARQSWPKVFGYQEVVVHLALNLLCHVLPYVWSVGQRQVRDMGRQCVREDV